MPTPSPSVLNQFDFFSGLPSDELAELAAHSRLTTLDPGEALFREGEPLEPALRFVYTGSLQIRRTAANGKETVIRLIRPGELFGVAALFDRKVAPGSAIACEPTQVIHIHLEALTEYLSEHPAMAIKLLVTFSERLHELQDTLHILVSGRAKTRLARVILRSFDQDGAIAEDGGYRLRTKLPHAMLSRMVGISYEECVRLLRDWTHDRALIRYERGGVITLLDQPGLEAEATAE